MGRPATQLLGEGLEQVCGRPTLALVSALVHQTKQVRTTKTKRIKHKQKAKRTAGIEGQVATVLKSHTRQLDTTAMTRARKNEKKNNQEETIRTKVFGLLHETQRFFL